MLFPKVSLVENITLMRVLFHANRFDRFIAIPVAVIVPRVIFLIVMISYFSPRISTFIVQNGFPYFLIRYALPSLSAFS